MSKGENSTFLQFKAYFAVNMDINNSEDIHSKLQNAGKYTYI